MVKHIVQQIYEGHLGRYDIGDVILETDDYEAACAAAGSAGPFGGAVIDRETGMVDVGCGWQTTSAAIEWLNAPAGEGE